ncbi:MAG: hypothetical protein IT328_07420 [Caldilineaceae bacterium]|nr:hypothetical protein [Caldilineaceae bacterium]
MRELSAPGKTQDKTSCKPKAQGRIAATYNYTDLDGTLLYQVVRYDPKDFKQRRPNGQGGWHWRLDDVKRVLYKLADLVATPTDQWVFIVEGEKDVDNLRAVGLAATSNVGGAGKWKAEYNQHFKGRKVCILPDNDDPGRRHAADVAKQLTGTAERVVVVPLEGILPKGDVSDWLAAGGNADELVALADAAQEYTRAQDANPDKPISQVIADDLKRWGYHLQLNVTDDQIMVNGKPLDDVNEAHIRVRARDDGYSKSGKPSLDALKDVLYTVAHQNSHHPIKEYLDSLEWDGSDRFMLMGDLVKDAHEPIDYGEAGKAPVFPTLLYRWMIGAVAKVYSQGAVRAQNRMLVLSGGQNLGKSTLVAWLGSPLPGLFFEGPINPDHPEHIRYLATKFVWEVAELGATTRRADREALKHFLTQQDVTFRVPYARHPVTKPSVTSFIGTINPMAGFLDDPTGDRRYMVVNLKSIDHSYTERVDIDQLWAQAVAAYRRNPNSWQLSPAELRAVNANNEESEVERPYEGRITDLFIVDPDREEPEWWIKTTDIVDTLRSAGVNFDEARLQTVLGTTLAGLGLKRKQRRIDDDLGNSKKRWGYQGLKRKPAKLPGQA